MRPVVVLGSLNMDLTLAVDRLPQAGETVLGGALRTTPGGKGANQAVAARRLGAAVRMVGRVGADAFGQSLRRGLAAEGIVSDSVTVDPRSPTGAALILVDPQGENQIAVAPGANGAVDGADVERALAALASDGVLVLQLEIPLTAVAAALTAPRPAGAIAVVNAAPATRELDPLLDRIDVLVVNESEAARLSDTAGAGRSGAHQAGARLRQRGVATVVITLGAGGAVVVDAEGPRWEPAPTVRAVDATAAGDAFVGALAAGLAAGRRPRDLLAFANAAGAVAATRPGAQVSLPGLHDLRELVDTSWAQA